MIKRPVLKEHPYFSHISRFAVFPSFSSPDDPDQGVRAASRRFPNGLIPNKAHDVTVISKTIGGPYRHEILKTPLNTQKKSVTWSEETSLLDPLKEEKPVFYPAPPKTILPKPKLRGWDLSLSERTSNMLKNLEKSLWVTSYQMHYTGSGPAYPLKMDDFEDKTRNLSGIHSHSVPLRERSYPVFVPSKPNQGQGRRSKMDWSTWNTMAAGLQDPALNQNNAFSNRQPQEIPATHSEAPVSNQMGHSQSKYRTRFMERQQDERHQLVGSKRAVHQGRGRETNKVRFDETLTQESESRSSQEVSAVQLPSTERHLDLKSHPSSQTITDLNRGIRPKEMHKNNLSSRKNEIPEGGNPLRGYQPAAAKDRGSSESSEKLITRSSTEMDGKAEGRDLLSVPNPAILPRPPILPGRNRSGSDLSLLELQHSFSKSEAHKNFHSSVTRGAVNLRDNVVSGKKHNFFGINCNYIHG